MKTALLLMTLALMAACSERPAAPPPPVAPAPVAPAPAAPAPSAVDAHQLALGRCTICHDEKYLTQQRLTPEQWKKTVDKMKGFGAPVTDDEAHQLAEYLAKSYPTDKPEDPIVMAAKPTL